MNEGEPARVKWCGICQVQIHRGPPFGDEPGRWVHGHTLKHRCSFPFGGVATPRDDNEGEE